MMQVNYYGHFMVGMMEVQFGAEMFIQIQPIHGWYSLMELQLAEVHTGVQE